MFVVKEFPNRIFDSTGDTVDREWEEISVLDGVFFEGHQITEDEFDDNGRLIYL